MCTIETHDFIDFYESDLNEILSINVLFQYNFAYLNDFDGLSLKLYKNILFTLNVLKVTALKTIHNFHIFHIEV